MCVRGEPYSFDRSSLTAAASLNELMILAGPYHGRSGADLLSRDAVAALAPGLDPLRLTDELAAQPERLASVGREIGKRVGALVSTLRRGPHDPPVPHRTPERIRALEEWEAIDDVILGGGLLVGPMGRVVLEEAQRCLGDAPPTQLSVSPHAPWLGLIGAARSCGEGEHLVIDGGQTSVKPAVAGVSGGVLRRLRLLPAVSFDSDDDVLALLERLLSIHSRWVSDAAVPCAIAAYVREGRPIEFGRNAYERLATAPRSTLDRLLLLHDGAAAWRGTGRDSSSAVIVLGTWLGVGMGPRDAVEDPLRPLSADFEILPSSNQP